MKKTNKLISILLVFAMLLSMAPISVFAATVEASGKFGASGSNLTWLLDSDGVLTVSGSGAMEDFASVSKVPWYSKRAKVKTVVIESGVTNIGKDAFYGISSLVNATISDTVTSIGNRAFSGSGLTNFEFSDAGNLKTIGNAAFSSTQIKNMVIPDGVTTLGSYVFGYGPIKSVTIPASVTSIGNYFFEETSGLNEVIFLGNKEPENVGDTVFLGCSSLAYVSVPADYEGDTFSNMKVAKAVASVAEVNGQGFATLADAISAAQSINGAVLKLLSHISVDSGITIESGNFTIDLNGKELFSNGYFLLRVDGADVTIVDSAGGGIFNATNDQGNIVLEVLSGSANISGGTFNSAGYPATVRDGTLKLSGKDFVLNGNWRIGWYGGSVDLSACTADEVRIQACADGLQASAVTLPDGWGLFETDGTPCTDFVKNDIYVAKAGFKVTASVNPAEGGTVEGAGTYSSGATVNLSATAANGYRFINWIENGEEVSTSAVYTFTASGNRELTANFEIVPHTHSFTYTAGGSRIVATCVAGDCPLENGIGGMLTISAPADLYVDGETAKEAVIDNQLVEAVDYTVTYSTADGSAPKTAGTYTASVTLGGATASVEFTLLNYAAKVTDKDGNELSGSPYKTLAAAITAAQGSEGSTVTLLDDITLTKEQNIRSGKFTLDLNGKNLINENGRVLYILEEADLTIKDSGEGGTIETKDESVDCIYNYGKLTVESGIIKGDGGIRNFGVLYFNDGTVEADNYPAIANYNDSTVYVYDGVLKGGKNSGAVENGGTLYVYGGEIESIVNVNDAYISGGKIDRDDYVALNLLGGTVEITGGSFTGTDNEYGRHSGTPYGEWTVDIDEGATLILKGGEFPNGFVVDDTTANAFLAEDYYYKDADGKLITVSDDAKVIDGYVKVSKGADLADAVITLDSTEFTYNGSEIKPTVIVTVGGKTLTEGEDYTLTFANNVNAGTATVTVTGAGDYKGEATKEFTIVKADNTVNAAPVPNTLTYNGEAHNLISAGEAMYGTMVYSLDGTEYSETIPQGTDAGYYTVYYKVIGDANHADTEPETVTVTIDKKAVTVSATVPDRIYGDDYRVDTSKVVITFDGIVEGDDVGYVVTVAYYHVHTVTDNAPVQVDYNVNGADADNYQFPEFGESLAPNYGVEATGRVLPRDIANAEITLGDALVYNGTEQTQTVAAVTVDGLEATYTVSGNKATNVGVYELTITGNGNFTGTKTALYEIAPDTAAIDDLTVDNVKSSDREDIEAVKAQIKNAVTDLADDEKKAEYKAITDKCDKLLSKINDTANEIERIDKAVNGYDKETVTSDDIPELGKLIDDIKALTDGDNLTEDEKTALEETEKATDELVEKLAEVAEEINRADEAVKSYDEETVKSTDKDDLTQLKEDIQNLIDSTNTTESEKTALEEMIKDIEGLEDKITETEEKLEEIKDIENNFNPETVTSDDKAAIEEAIDEIEAVNPDNLSDEQKAEYEEIKAGFEALLEEIAAAENAVADIGAQLEMFDEKRVTKFWEDDIEALKAKIDELLADENMGETEKAKLNEYKAQAEKLTEIINTPKEYFSLRFFYLIWDCLTWKYNGILWIFSKIFG